MPGSWFAFRQSEKAAVTVLWSAGRLSSMLERKNRHPFDRRNSTWLDAQHQ